jgi:Domain of unknown function (DUF4279)
LTHSEESDSNENSLRRFDVELFIVHPTIDPMEISAALGLTPNFMNRVGDQRKTPKGALLPGKYKDTRWRHSRRYEVSAQWFVDKVIELIDYLEPHRAFLSKICSTGGGASIVIQFLGDGYFGDEIPRDVLARIVNLDLDIGIECF